MPDIRIRNQNNIMWLFLDRTPLNILSIEMLDHLTAAMRDATAQQPRLVVLMGAGDSAFSAGVDVRDHLHGREREMLRAVYDNCAAFEALREAHIPTAALVKGHALGGGCELAALCDTVIAHEDASFGLPEINLGVFPPIAAAYFPARIGTQATMRLILTGETISAREAFRIGLVHQVLPDRRFLPDAEELLAMLAS